eukprot:TRINITY_DN888_c0_g1_i2.p2 TRINITY_DN888_c0_g1~~TRINITY_DN888_c0_g1_i2.p2  ORF type:complete len:158 (-),score=56.14 TRINITY_DN888_c0_g1_i2:239-712(-)
MSLSKFVVVLLAVLIATAAGAVTCPSSCNDSPPTNENGDVEFTCEEQAGFGQCEAGWMSGYCQCACQVCQYEETTDEVMPEETGTESHDAVPAETSGETDMLPVEVNGEMAVEAPAPELTKEEKQAAKAAKKAEKEAKKAAKAARKAAKEAKAAEQN